MAEEELDWRIEFYYWTLTHAIIILFIREWLAGSLGRWTSSGRWECSSMRTFFAFGDEELFSFSTSAWDITTTMRTHFMHTFSSSLNLLSVMRWKHGKCQLFSGRWSGEGKKSWKIGGKGVKFQFLLARVMSNDVNWHWKFSGLCFSWPWWIIRTTFLISFRLELHCEVYSKFWKFWNPLCTQRGSILISTSIYCMTNIQTLLSWSSQFTYS